MTLIKNHKRSLAKIVQIDRLIKHPNADTLDIATVGGWKVVAKSGQFKEGDRAVYFEIDSWIPHSLAPFLSGDNEPKVFEDVPGALLRTVRLRKQVSQGLLMTMEQVFGDQCGFTDVGTDLTDVLGIKKWEPELPAELLETARGYYPSDILKTDQERIQNLAGEIQECFETGMTFEESIKLDGESMTVYCRLERDGEPLQSGVCSKSLDFIISEDSGNYMVRNAVNSGLLAALTEYCQLKNRSLAIQGEIIGQKIRGNKEGIHGQKFHMFDVFDMDKYEKLSPQERADIFTEIKAMDIDHALFDHVPVTNRHFTLPSGDVEDLLTLANGKSLSAKMREGTVYKSEDGQFSFKIISNEWLLKHE